MQEETPTRNTVTIRNTPRPPEVGAQPLSVKAVVAKPDT
jgi:hypothetical protein